MPSSPSGPGAGEEESASEIRILFIGDVIGRSGRRAVLLTLPDLRRRRSIDLVIANGENLAGGFGLTEETATEVFDGLVEGTSRPEQAFVVALTDEQPAEQ